MAINTSPVNFALAAALSLLLFIAIALALLVQAGILRTRSFQVISGRNRPARTIELGGWKWPAMAFCLVVFLLLRFVPWLVGRFIQRGKRRKMIDVSASQTIEQELRITAGRI